MSYFKLLESYETYRGSTSNFHFDYNSTSGGAQAFLAGTYVCADGAIIKPKDIKDEMAHFRVTYHDANDEVKSIELDSDENAIFPIKPRGENKGKMNQMKMAIEKPSGGKRIRPSLLMATFFMLPATCAIDNSSSNEVSPFSKGNYWLRSMWLTVDWDKKGTVVFTPIDYVFEGGRCKNSKKKKSFGDNERVFQLDYERRMRDIIELSNCDTLPGFALEALRYFRAVYTGTESFFYEKALSTTTELMKKLSAKYWDKYTGYGDPLDFLIKLCGNGFDVSHADIKQPRNLIFFGAPGTGKSFQLQEQAEESFAEGNVRRVTFHPDYTYAQFVGCYKPFIEPKIDNESDASEIRYASSEIEYRYIPGPFIDTYVDAIRHPKQNYLLIIEEINRANPAAVFGDVFQLLDRKGDGASEYSVETSEDLRWYMFKQWKSYLNGIKPEERKDVLYSLDDPEAKNLASSISLPPNMYIWATMNSADQGVFPMDTAFKRRWDFRYMGIDEGSDELDYIEVMVRGRKVKWNDLRSEINNVLLNAGVNEDKLLGPFFIKPERIKEDTFTQVFKDKVLLYLFEDAAKTKKTKVFNVDGGMTYSNICSEFEKKGEKIFKGIGDLAPVEDDEDGESNKRDDNATGE